MTFTQQYSVWSLVDVFVFDYIVPTIFIYDTFPCTLVKCFIFEI